MLERENEEAGEEKTVNDNLGFRCFLRRRNLFWMSFSYR
jgi:hypothetical protein